MRIEPYVIETGAGQPVVLLHAFPLNASMWLAQREALGTTHRVITPDQRGFGGTQLGHDQPSLDEVADDVAAMLDARKLDRVVLGGLSMGGYVAMAFLRRHAERVSALILADTKIGADSPEAAANRRRIADEVIAAGSSAQLVDALLPSLLGETSRQRRALVVGRVKALIEKAPAYAVAWAQRAMAERPDSAATLAAVSVPTLVVVGEEDTISPPDDAELIAKTVPGATLTRIPAAGHLSAVEAPAEFNAVVSEFLAGLPTAD
ncbi:MAG TPA: alpha/beta fold hydrolase [Mycobacteriales bacterium]|nr:alpha/beta fold hydrolase [Mycobacteriales bacterium]